MTRFWNRIVQPFNLPKVKQKSIIFNEYTAIENDYLRESTIYGKHLVSTDKLSKAYHNLPSSRKWKHLNPFVQVWYSEFEKVNKQTQIAMDILSNQLNEISRKLTAIASPLKNYNRKLLKKANQFISNYLKDYNTPNIINEACFKYHYHSLESKRKQELCNYEPEAELAHCIRLIYRFEQLMCLHYYYVYSQFHLLKDIGETVLKTEESTDPLLSQVILARWKQKYTQHETRHSQLLQQFQDMLTNSMPSQKDVTCAICLYVLKEPTTIQSCQHTFCRACLQKVYCNRCHKTKSIYEWITKSLPAISCQCLEKQACCPLCRAKFETKDCQVDLELEKFISLYFPDMKQEERKEEKEIGIKNNFYSKVQRWSNKISDSTWLNHDPFPQVQLTFDMVLMTRRSWIM